MVTYPAVKALIKKDNKVLIIEQKFNNQDYLNLPGGKLQKNEPEIDALHRELMEELSVKIEIIKPIGYWEFIKESTKDKIICHTFLCKLKGNIDLSKSPKKEHITNYYWFKKEELLNLKNLPDKSLKELFESIQELI